MRKSRYVLVQKIKKGDRTAVGKVINMTKYTTNPEISAFGLKMPTQLSDGVHLEFDGGFLLKCIFNRPTTKEKDAFKNGVPQFGIAVVNDVIFFLSRFGTLNWMDAPFNVHLYPDSLAAMLEEPRSTQGYELRVKLIDGATGTLVHQRLIGLDHDLSMCLFDAIIHQPVIPNYNQRLQLTMAKCTTMDLVALGCSYPASKVQNGVIAGVPKLRPSQRGLTGIKKDDYRLPKKLRKFNYFYPDGTGHVVMAIPKSLLPQAIKDENLDDYECPIPCRYILKKGYHFHEGHVICDVPYDEDLGVDLDESWYEG